MKYAAKDMNASGIIPECGAIFMTNIAMKKICFKHKVFALPSSKSEFVKHIKSGMALFLFEYEKRELFGVYQAISDGAMSIVSQGFHYKGRHFPAQVRFTRIWECNPLSEHEFRDAIIENYFSAKKFNLGLSEDQVHRLLLLFIKRKLKNKIPTHLETEANQTDVKDILFIADDRFSFSDRTYKETYNGFQPTIRHDYRENSLTRVKEDGFFMNRINNEGKIYSRDLGIFNDYPDELLLKKRRRMENGDMLCQNSIREDGLCNNHGTLDTEKNSLAVVRRGVNDHQTVADSEDHGGKNLNAVLSAEYPMGPLNVRTTDGDLFMHGNMVLGDLNMVNSLEHTFDGEGFEKPLNRSSFSIDDDRLFMDDCVQREYNIRNFSKASGCGDGNLNLLSQSRKVTDDHQYMMSLNMENRFHVAGFSSENFANPRTIHDGKVFNVDRKVSECIVDNILCSDALKHSRCIESVGGRLVDYGRSRKSEIENLEDIHKYVSPAIPSDPLSLSKAKQNLFLFSDKLLSESECSQLTAPQSFDPSHTTFDHETNTEAFLYDPEHPYITHGYSSSLAADHNSSLVPENHRYYGFDGTYSSLSNKFSLPYFPESKASRTYLDMEHEGEEKGLEMYNASCQSSFHQQTINSSLNSKIRMDEDLDTSALVGYVGSLFSKHSIYSAPATNFSNIGGDRGFPYSFKSSEQDSAFDRNISVASQYMNEHISWGKMDMLDGKKIPVPDDFSRHIHQSKRDLISNDGHFLRMSHNMNLKEHQGNSEAPRADSHIRRSVFTRLTSAQNNQVDEYRNGDSFSSDSCYMDTSADEVMEMFRKDHNLSRKKLKNRVVGLPKHGENFLDEKQIRNHVDINQLTADKKRSEDSYLTTIEGFDKVPKETRIVDFKRRSETKKSSVVVKKNTDVHREVPVSTEKISKRRRLVRPVFKESELDGDGLASNQNSSVPCHISEKDDKHSESAISTREVKISHDSTRSSHVLPLSSPQSQSPDCDNEENTIDEAQKDPGSFILSSTHNELKGHTTSNVVLQSSQVVIEDTSQHKISGIETCNCDNEENTIDESQNDPGSYILSSTVNELNGHTTSNVILQSSQVVIEDSSQHKISGIGTCNCDNEENTIDEAQKDPGSYILSSTINELKGHTTSNVVLQTLQVVIEDTSQYKISGIETCNVGALSRDEKISSLNML